MGMSGREYVHMSASPAEVRGCWITKGCTPVTGDYELRSTQELMECYEPMNKNGRLF